MVIKKVINAEAMTNEQFAGEIDIPFDGDVQDGYKVEFEDHTDWMTEQEYKDLVK